MSVNVDKTLKKTNKITVALWITIGASIFGIALRLYQYFSILEPETGFFKEKDFTVYLLYIGLLIAAIAIASLSFFEKKFEAREPYGKHIFLGIITAFFAIALLIDAIQQTNMVMALYENSYATIKETALYIFFRKGGFFYILQSLLAVLSAVYFFLIALTYFDVLKSYAPFKLLALTPLLWMIVRIVLRFTRTIRFRNVSELVLELCSFVAMMLFLMAFARLSSRVNIAGALKRIYAFGFVGAMLMLTTSIPRLIITVIGQSNMLANDLHFCLVDLALAVFALAYLLTCRRTFFKIQKNDNTINESNLS